MFQLTRTSSPDPRLQPWNKSRRLNEQLRFSCWACEDARPTAGGTPALHSAIRSEEHTSELQSRENLVCRLLLEKKKTTEAEDKKNETRAIGHKITELD